MDIGSLFSMLSQHSDTAGALGSGSGALIVSAIVAKTIKSVVGALVRLLTFFITFALFAGAGYWYFMIR